MWALNKFLQTITCYMGELRRLLITFLIFFGGLWILGLLPLLVPTATDVPSENSQNQGIQTGETQGSKTESDALTTCYQTIVESIRTHNPQLVSELQGFIMELRRITLLWEELWHGSLMQTHHDVTRRQQQLEDEIKRVSGNQNLTNQQKATLIREKHIAIMKPVSVVCFFNWSLRHIIKCPIRKIKPSQNSYSNVDNWSCQLIFYLFLGTETFLAIFFNNVERY